MVASLAASARSIASSTLTAPRQLHTAYASFITKNSSSVSQIESALRSLTYLLPNSTSTAATATTANGTSVPLSHSPAVSPTRALLSTELAPELVYSITQLLSLYHNYLLRKSISSLPSSRQPKPAAHTRYTKYWSNHSPLYARLATVLQCMQYTELLWEMLAKRRGGEKSRWRIVVILESLKAVLRLVIMRLTNSRPALNPSLPTREEPLPEPKEEIQGGPSKEEILAAEFPEWNEQPQANGHLHANGHAPEDHLTKANGHTIANGRPKENGYGDYGIADHHVAAFDSEKSSSTVKSLERPYNMPRTSQSLGPIPASTPTSISAYLLSHVLNPNDLKPAAKLLSSLSTTPALASEILYILRPVLYALLLQRLSSKHGTKKALADWRPWLLGIAMEFASFRLAAMSKSSSASWPTFRTDGLAAEERKKRQTAALWWLLRGAAWEGLTKKWVRGLSGGLKRWPILDLLGGVAEEHELLWENYYFSTAS